MMTPSITSGDKLSQDNCCLNSEQRKPDINHNSSGNYYKRGRTNHRGEYRSYRIRNRSRGSGYPSTNSMYEASESHFRRNRRYCDNKSYIKQRRYFRSHSRDSRENKYSIGDRKQHHHNYHYCEEHRSYVTSKYDLDDNDTDNDDVVDNGHRLYHKRRDRKDHATKISSRHPQFSDLPLEWWEREEDCKLAKEYHTEKIDRLWPSREDLVLQTTLAEEDTVLEENMFPYKTPKGIAHYTLWSIHDLSHSEIVSFVDSWLLKHHPQVRRWQYDDNSGERSILLFHVHVFIEMEAFSFTPRPGLEYFPPHMN